MGRLFGTDGARGVAVTELTCELAMNIGRAAAFVLTKKLHARPKILIGKDTRISSDVLEAALLAGICSVGVDAHVVGVVPTPAVSYLVKHYGADAGVMISASHNPVEFNGIKLFSGTGYKLSDALEEEIEEYVLDCPNKIQPLCGEHLGRIFSVGAKALEDYRQSLLEAREAPLTGMSIAIDCANGSASVMAEDLFTALGASCIMLNDKPDGTNINKSCGSTDMHNLCETVRKLELDAGIAFDGDADRCLAVDEKGEIVDGDRIIAICADYFKKQGRLLKDTAVVTVMSNLGFSAFCRENQITPVITKVGDRYVLEEMLSGGFVIGGEQSGHVIFLEDSNTGDGQLTAVKLLGILSESDKKLSELASIMRVYPQFMDNVTIPLSYRGCWMKDETVTDLVDRLSAQMSENGRILVRESGTEPLIRVMAEGTDIEQIHQYVKEIVDALKNSCSIVN